MCGFIAQLVEHRTGIAEVMGSNPVEALIFFRLLLSNCLNWKIYFDDHTSLSELMFLGIDMFWALLSLILASRLAARAKMSLSRAQNISMPANINSIVIFYPVNKGLEYQR